MTQLTTVSVAIDVQHTMRHTFEVDWDRRRLTHLRTEIMPVPAPRAAEAEARQASRGSDPEVVVVEREAGLHTEEDRWPEWCDMRPNSCGYVDGYPHPQGSPAGSPAHPAHLRGGGLETPPPNELGLLV